MLHVSLSNPSGEKEKYYTTRLVSIKEERVGRVEISGVNNREKRAAELEKEKVKFRVSGKTSLVFAK